MFDLRERKVRSVPPCPRARLEYNSQVAQMLSKASTSARHPRTEESKAKWIAWASYARECLCPRALTIPMVVSHVVVRMHAHCDRPRRHLAVWWCKWADYSHVCSFGVCACVFSLQLRHGFRPAKHGWNIDRRLYIRGIDIVVVIDCNSVVVPVFSKVSRGPCWHCALEFVHNLCCCFVCSLDIGSRLMSTVGFVTSLEGLPLVNVTRGRVMDANNTMDSIEMAPTTRWSTNSLLHTTRHSIASVCPSLDMNDIVFVICAIINKNSRLSCFRTLCRWTRRTLNKNWPTFNDNLTLTMICALIANTCFRQLWKVDLFRFWTTFIANSIRMKTNWTTSSSTSPMHVGHNCSNHFKLSSTACNYRWSS